MCQVFANQAPERYSSTTRRLWLNGQSTSIRLENAFWEVIDQITENDGVTKKRSKVAPHVGDLETFTSYSVLKNLHFFLMSLIIRC